MIEKVKNTPTSGKDIKIYIFREGATTSNWRSVASFKSAQIEASVEDAEYDYFGSAESVSYSQKNTVNITLERGHVNARILKEFKETMSTSNCAFNRPYYLMQIEVCFPGDDEDSGTYLYQIINGVMKSDSLNLQAGAGENSETLIIKSSSYDIFKMNTL